MPAFARDAPTIHPSIRVCSSGRSIVTHAPNTHHSREAATRIEFENHLFAPAVLSPAFIVGIRVSVLINAERMPVPLPTDART